LRERFSFGEHSITQKLKLNAVDIAGFNPDERARIEAIGLRAWLDEVATSPAATPSPIGPA